MPAPAVYVLAVVGTIGAAYAFHQFVYEPHIAPKIELWAEEFIARRRARRMQLQGSIPVPASIPLRRRHRREGRGSKNSDSTLSDSESNSDSDPDVRRGGPSTHQNRGSRQTSSSFTSAHGVDFDSDVAREVSEWRSEVGRSQTSNNLRHRTNRVVHAMDESINPIPHSIMSPTHVIFDTSGPTTPTTTTVPSIISSPPAQVSPLLTTTTESTLHPSPNRAPTPLKPSHISQTRTPLLPSPSFTAQTNRAPTGPVSRSVISPAPDTYTPPSFSSPILSLSQSYPQELDRERDVELLSRPSSGTSSPFTTFSPLAVSQPLSPSAIAQPLDRNPSSSETRPWSLNPVSRSSSPSQHTVTDAEYRSLPASPTSHPSELSSPVHVTHEPIRSPSPQEDLLHPELTNFTSPNAISPRSPHSDLSELELESDFDLVSDPGSE